METYKIQEGINLYFVTFTVVEWLPVFIEETPFKIITDSLNYCIHNKNLRVNAYVVMPNHLHAIIFDKEFDNTNLKQSLDDFRKFSGRKLADYCDARLSPIFGQALRREAGKDRLRRFWQPTKHPEGIVSEWFWKQKTNYIHENPVRKGLVNHPQDWRFSSVRFWLDGDVTGMDVEIDGIGW